MTLQTAIITGAASGIGRHWAEALSKIGGYQLMLADSNEAGLREAFTPRENILLRPLDIRSAEHWQKIIAETLQRFGRIDYLFNIAGANRPLFFQDQPLSAIDQVIDVNLKGALIGMRLTGEVMLKQGAGHIVNIASLAAISPTPGNALYSAAKGGLRNASIAVAIEWRKRGVFVTVISPDLVDTPILTERLNSAGEEAALAFSGATLTVFDLEKALWKAMRAKPLEINLPRWRGWLTKLNDLNPSLMFLLYEKMKQRGMKRLEQLRKER
ncbi:MAG: SDR family oxidoreductase [Anaerolineales bacterium]|nr:MAG: SDR family oxidoreductase [Anaerolineales bacterium]